MNENSIYLGDRLLAVSNPQRAFCQRCGIPRESFSRIRSSVPLLKSIRKAAVSHGSVEGWRCGFARARGRERDGTTKKLIRLSWVRWGGRTDGERGNDLVCEKARKDGRRVEARGRLRGVKGRVKRGERIPKG